MPVEPTAEQLERLAASGDDRTVVMLNLLRFKQRADGIDAGLSGAEAYARYSVAVQPFLDKVGGRLMSALLAHESVVGPANGEWDLILLVEYPSRRRFLEMVSDPDYVRVHRHREAAVEDSRLIACSTLDGSIAPEPDGSIAPE